MGGGASVDSATAAAASEEEVAKALEGLSADTKAKILKALKAPTSDDVAANSACVKDNAAHLHMLNNAVMGNKQCIYAERAFIEENRALLLKNYAAAFMGNRQMANQNTDEIFKNRRAIVQAMTAADAVQENCRQSRLNEAQVDMLEHRANMNTRVAEVNEKMAAINKLLIEVNNTIMEGNAEIVEFNSKHLEFNRKLLDKELGFGEATPETNAERIEKNAKRIGAITERAQGNAEKHAAVLKAAKDNRDSILENSKVIYERRAEMEANGGKIAENAAKVADLIAGK